MLWFLHRKTPSCYPLYCCLSQMQDPVARPLNVPSMGSMLPAQPLTSRPINHLELDHLQAGLQEEPGFDMNAASMTSVQRQHHVTHQAQQVQSSASTVFSPHGCHTACNSAARSPFLAAARTTTTAATCSRHGTGIRRWRCQRTH